MAFKLADRVKETTTTTGTGSVTLAGAATGYQAFFGSAALAVGDTTLYAIEDQAGANWEIGIGTLNSSTLLARTTVISSSNSGSLVNFGAGTKNVFITDPASRIIAPDFITSINSGPLAGFRNRIMNGDMRIDQRNSGSATTTSTSAWTYTVDRWYSYSTGATVNGQRTAGTGGTQYRYRLTGAASVTAIGFGQRIEASNIYDLQGTTVTLGVDLANSLLTTVTWTAYYPTNSDSYGTFASPTRTQIATGTFTVNSTLTRYNAQIALPANATNGVEILFTVGAQTSGQWDISNVQIEPGTTATPFERRPLSVESGLCYRYFYAPTSGSRTFSWYGEVTGRGTPIWYSFPVTMRATPTATTAFSATANCASATITVSSSDVFAFIPTATTGGAVATLTLGTFSAEL
jgi:hypothetical protein